MKTPMIGAAMALLTACAAQAHTEAPLPLAPPAAACAIRETETANGVLLEATVRAGRNMPGTYDFVITSKASGGSSDIAQGGEIDLTADRTVTAGTAEIPRGRYRAVLTVEDAHGELCRAVRKS